MDYHLLFPDEAAARAVLYTDEQPNYANIDTIGIIYKRTGGTDEEPVMEPIPGWHVNVRVVGEDTVALAPFKIDVKTPVRVWA